MLLLVGVLFRFDIMMDVRLFEKLFLTTEHSLDIELLDFNNCLSDWGFIICPLLFIFKVSISLIKGLICGACSVLFEKVLLEAIF